MPLIAQQTVQEVLAAAAIQDVVASYFPLKKAGGALKALCPFHDEKTPSFTVNPARQIFKCFGCGKGGNVVTFVMEMDKTDFPGAIELLAERYGITVARAAGGGEADEPAQLLRLHEAAAQFFRRMLLHGSSGERARAYLTERGVTDESAERFGLGYAPGEWDALLKRLRASGFSDRLIRRSGLVVEADEGRRVYDRFRDRLIFPIRNPRGKVIAFGGRLLPEAEAKGGKYINSPETPIFRKSQHLYGQELLDRSTEEVVVVEGYFDVLLPIQQGLKGFVAPMGTAFGSDHARLVRRYARRCTLIFDADAAGQAASERGLDLLLGEELDLAVAALPAGMKDPADAAAAPGGAEALRAAIGSAAEMFDYLLERAAGRRDLSRTAERAAVADELLERVGRVEDPVRRDLYAQKVAARLGLDVEALRARLRRPVPVRPRAAPPAAPRPEASRLRTDALTMIRWMLETPEAVPRVRERLGEGFGPPAAGRVAAAIYALHARDGRVDWTELQALLPEAEEQSILADAQMLPPPASDLERDLESFAAELGRRDRTRRIRELKEALRQAKGEEQERIARELRQLKNV